MKINTLTVLKTIDGQDLKMPAVNGSPALPLTLRRACIEALMFPHDGETGEQKFQKWMLATKINLEDDVNLAPEEITALKAAIGHWGAPAVVGPAFQILNG